VRKRHKKAKCKPVQTTERHELITRDDLRSCERNWQTDPEDSSEPRKMMVPMLQRALGLDRFIAMEKRLRVRDRAAVFAGFAVEKAAGKPVVSAAEHWQWMIDNEQVVDAFYADDRCLGWKGFWAARGEPVGDPRPTTNRRTP